MSTSLSHTKSTLRPGFHMSPGFYVDYWERFINAQFTQQQIMDRVELKPHREVWVGSIFAASQTLVSGIPHFVGLPQDEPPDVEVVKHTETTTPKGNPGIALGRIKLEITRCSIGDGENLYDQISKKNKPAYSGLELLVYEYGGKTPSDYESLHTALNNETIYPGSIMAVASVRRTGAGIELPDGTFAVTRLYPRRGQTFVTVSDPKAFFKYPEVITVTKRGPGTAWVNMGSFELLAPTLKPKRQKK